MAQSPSTRDLRTAGAQPILDARLLDDITNIMQQCGTNAVTTSVRILPAEAPTVVEVKTISTVHNADGTTRHDVTDGHLRLFHIASLTKPLVGTALFIAANREPPPIDGSREIDKTDIQTTELEERGVLKKFRTIKYQSLVHLYKGSKLKDMSQLDGFDDGPTIVDLLKHKRGFPSANFQMLSADAVSIMKLADSRSKIFDRIPRVSQTTKWAGYSNLNYTAIALAIETMWGESFESFMKANLFDPLKMDSTSIGMPSSDNDTDIDPDIIYVVDSDHETILRERPPYRADGAEAAALGAYSTAHDLDLFHKFIVEVNRSEPIPGCHRGAFEDFLQSDEEEHREREMEKKEEERQNIMVKVKEVMKRISKKMKMGEEEKEEAHMVNDAESTPNFTPFGIYTKLNSSDIGWLSINRAQFPKENFSTYTVFSDDEKSPLDVFYMTGSTNGCSCVSVLHPGTSTTNAFSVIVLTDTSGPVDAADHISRLILQKVARLVDPPRANASTTPSVNIIDMVRQNCAGAFQSWNKTIADAKKDMDKYSKTFQVDKDLTGTYKEQGSKQRLEISEGEGGTLWISVDGPEHLSDPLKSRLYWIDHSSVKLYTQPHFAIDSLARGDWADIVFEVGEADGKIMLSHQTSYVKLRFIKQS